MATDSGTETQSASLRTTNANKLTFQKMIDRHRLKQ